MAVARPPAGGAGGVKIALIVFVVLTVASLTFAIILYTGQADLEAEVERAQDQASAARTQANQAESKLRDFAKDILGESLDDPAAIEARIEEERSRILRDDQLEDLRAAEGEGKAPLLEILTRVHDQFSDQAQALEDAQERIEELNSELQTVTQTMKQQEETFSTELENVKQQYQQLAEANEEFRTERSDLLEQLREEHQTQLEQVGRELDEERRLREQAEETLAQERRRSAELASQLEAFKPTGAEGTILQAKDGEVVRTFAGDDIVYINLGRRDNVRSGMTFSVYSAARGIPADGKGKAHIEVSNVYESTSECKVTMTTPGEPIVEGDVIANPVYDRTRQFRFAVAGDFDLDFDGKIEDPSGQQVSRLIEHWGGNVVDEVDTRTDFLVRGEAPALLVLPENEEITPAQEERAEEMKQRRDAFDARVQRARELSVPILTRTQFLHFMGYGSSQGDPEADEVMAELEP